MVRLKVEVILHKETIQRRFQFQNGAIKSRNTPLLTALKSMFQFQNGAIKRAVATETAAREAAFQFQNGAIKRYWIILFCGCIRRFNSKMVRLKAPIASLLIPFYRVSIPKWCD